jgi:hypothetical protein
VTLRAWYSLKGSHLISSSFSDDCYCMLNSRLFRFCCRDAALHDLTRHLRPTLDLCQLGITNCPGEWDRVPFSRFSSAQSPEAGYRFVLGSQSPGVRDAARRQAEKPLTRSTAPLGPKDATAEFFRGGPHRAAIVANAISKIRRMK